ncbi:MAG: TetR family transcriptional regulator [Solirubrobacteraceae bacterium]
MTPPTRAPSSVAVPVPTKVDPQRVPAERVAEIQRARMLSATVEIAAEQGAAKLTVTRIVARSGVSRRTFYEIFKDCEDCLLAALEDALDQAAEVVVPAYRSERKWHERCRAALRALLELFDERPDLARLLVVDSLGTGSHTLKRRRYVLAQLIDAVDEGREEAQRGSEPPPLSAEGIVGAVLSVIHARLHEFAPAEQDLLELTNPLMSMIVLPYLGRAAAARELSRPVARRRASVSRPVGNPLRALDMRLTYRTVRVLMSVGSSPGCSNRQVGVAAGIVDQGQISKLLARLERLGLVHNVGLEPGRGAPNAWALTEGGLEVQQLLAQESSRA